MPSRRWHKVINVAVALALVSMLGVAFLPQAAHATDPPTVTNSTGASNVTTSAARLNGEVTDNGGEDPTVDIYWGDNDGGVTPGNWDYVENLGIKGIGTFYKDISNLSPNTTYYYRCYATNSAGSDWANSSASFTTTVSVTAPTVTNSTGASNVTTSAARLNGEVTSTGGEDPTVHIYWGDNDGGMTPGNWDHEYLFSRGTALDIEQNWEFFHQVRFA